MVSENFQAAAKAVLLKERSVLQAFELSLQACIKQKPTVSSSALCDMTFEIFYYYMHYDNSHEDEDKEILNGAEPNSEQVKSNLKKQFFELQDLVDCLASIKSLKQLFLFCKNGRMNSKC
jgi:hypothetical protein